jgi:hypothetical protein
MANIADASSLATIQGLLKEVWTDIYKPTQNLIHPLLSEAQKARHIEFDGKKIRGAVNLKLGGNVISIGEGKKLPKPGQGHDAQWETQVSYTYARFAFTGPALATTRRNKGSYKRLVARLTDDRMKSIRLYKNRVLHANGDGVLCKVASVVGNDITVQDSYGVAGAGPGTRFIRADEFYAVLAPNGTVRGRFTATDVDKANDVITADAVPGGTAAGDLIVLATEDDTAFGREPKGLLALVDDADGTVLGIDNTDPKQKAWRSPIINAGGGITDHLIMRAHMRVRAESGQEVGRDNYFQMTTPGLYLAFGQTLTGLKRFNDTYELKGGFSTVDVNGMPMFIDFDAPLGMYTIVCKEDIAFVDLEDLGYIDLDGSIYARMLDVDGFEVAIKEYWSFIVLRRNTHLRIEGLTGDDPSLVRGGGAY